MEATLTVLDDMVRSVVDGATALNLGMSDDGVASRLERYRAEIPLMGSWRGCLRVEIAPALAREMAGAMLHCPPNALDEGTTMDAVGEIANMIAGNLRPLIKGAHSLGVPTVTRQGGSSGDERPVLGRAFGARSGQMEVELFSERGVSAFHN
jgi:CheY-specific phosphatase CheX